VIKAITILILIHWVIQRVAANIMTSSCRQQTRGGPPAWRLGKTLITEK